MISQSKSRAIKLIIVDIIFALLPALILLLTRVYNMKFKELLFRPDWSYISLILYGQVISKSFLGISSNENRKNSSGIALIMTLIIAFGLIPSGIILVILELSTLTNIVALVLQYVFLVGSIISYIIFGSIAQILSDNQKIRIEELEK